MALQKLFDITLPVQEIQLAKPTRPLFLASTSNKFEKQSVLLE